MSIIKSFSERERERLGDVPDVFVYDHLPGQLRVQIIKVWDRFFGSETEPSNHQARNYGWKTFRKETEEMLGIDDLYPNTGSNQFAVVEFFKMRASDTTALDLIELFAIVAARSEEFYARVRGFHGCGTPAIAIDEINVRFRQHGLGYAIVYQKKGMDPFLIRKDSEHIHQDVVRPALQLLHDQAFAGANDEYRSAHEHYRHDRYEECLTDCLKAFESTMKTIIARRKWPMPDKPVASALIKVCLTNCLLGSFMDQHLGNFQSALESGVPTVRNKIGAHGQGEAIRQVPRFYAEYMLHETAVNVVLLVEAFKAL